MTPNPKHPGQSERRTKHRWGRKTDPDRARRLRVHRP